MSTNRTNPAAGRARVARLPKGPNGKPLLLINPRQFTGQVTRKRPIFATTAAILRTVTAKSVSKWFPHLRAVSTWHRQRFRLRTLACFN